MKAAAESEGPLSVTDEEILAAYHRVATRDGLFAEPASAASVAGLLTLSASGRLERGSTLVCVLTGHGLKDPGWATSESAGPRPTRTAPQHTEQIVGRPPTVVPPTPRPSPRPSTCRGSAGCGSSPARRPRWPTWVRGSTAWAWHSGS